MANYVNPQRGEIWVVEFDPSIGGEIGKTRPAIVISRPSAGRLALRYTMPITDWKDRYEDYPWMEKLAPNSYNGLSKMSGADAFQCKSLSVNRFVKRLGVLKSAEITDLIQRLISCFE